MLKGRGCPTQRGAGLVETLIAGAILGTAVVAFASALATGSIAVGTHETGATARNLAQSQLEYTKACPYNPAGIYSQLPAPAGYTLSVIVIPVPNGDEHIQKIIVSVYRSGETLSHLEGYKVNR